MITINYGILGCGKHALQSHAIPGKDVSNLDLTSICDISEDQLKSFEQAYGRKLVKFIDKNKFLHSGIDAVLIGTPDEFHYQDLVSAVNAGVHTFVEKPLATTSEEIKGLEKVLSLASGNDLIVSSCHPRRYDPPFMWLKENLSELVEELGNPLEFGFDFSYHKPSKDWKHSRGLLLDHVNHEVDLLHYLFGHEEFEAIKSTDGFDHYHVTGKREDGINFKFTGTRRLESRKYLEWVRIRFERGDILLDAHQGLVKIHNHDRDSVDQIAIQPTDYTARGKGTMINFVEAINGSEPCYLSPSDLYVNTAMSVMLTENERWRYKI